MFTVADALRWGQQQLSQQPELQHEAVTDSSWILSHVLDQTLAWMRAWSERELTTEQYESFCQLIERRQLGEPVAYLTGKQGFWTLELEVNHDTLIPRPETELLVERVLELASEYALDPDVRVIDLGTGSGAIALALKSECPHWQMMATDISQAALVVAQRNAQNNGLDVEFRLSDWLSQVDGLFDFVVSNPPYIVRGDRHLDGVGVRFEPTSALVAEHNGLGDLDIVIKNAPDHLKQGGWLLVEHGYDQGLAVREMMLCIGFSRVQTSKDLSQNDRITYGQWLERKPHDE